MIFNNFRKTHLYRFFSLYEKEPLTPLDLLLTKYLRDHKQIGSTDRKILSDAIFSIVRWRELLDASTPSPPTWEKRIDLFISTPLSTLQANPSLAPHQLYSLPKELYTLILKSLGEEKGLEFCQSLGNQAPTTIRVNTLKTSRESLFDQWKSLYPISLTPHSQEGITFHQRINFFSLPEFTKGFFEIQDEGSQLSTLLVRAKPKEEILDYCAGAGGKSLAIAPRLQGKGQIFLHDIREAPLIQAKKRLKRAGVQNAQIVTKEKQLAPLKGRMDWVIADVPCSGSGTWRRNPDQKWKFTESNLHNLIRVQREIVARAIEYVKPGGAIVYITCSIFREENEEQLAYFQTTYNLKLKEPFFQSFPTSGGMDGFFAAALERAL